MQYNKLPDKCNLLKAMQTEKMNMLKNNIEVVVGISDYATKQTFERYKLKLMSELFPSINPTTESIIEQERGDKLLKWGGKLFYSKENAFKWLILQES